MGGWEGGKVLSLKEGLIIGAFTCLDCVKRAYVLLWLPSLLIFGMVSVGRGEELEEGIK